VIRNATRRSRKPPILTKSAKKAPDAREKKMRSIEKKIAFLKRDLDEQLPEEARKADAYPGWVRE
jgi:hypothetical protein